MRKWIIIIALIVIATIAYLYLYQDHRQIASEEPFVNTSALIIHEDFINKPQVSLNKYLNKTVEINGTISDIADNNITLNEKVFCQLSEPHSGLNKGLDILVKGRVIGFDDLLEELKLDQCIIIN